MCEGGIVAFAHVLEVESLLEVDVDEVVTSHGALERERAPVNLDDRHPRRGALRP